MKPRFVKHGMVMCLFFCMGFTVQGQTQVPSGIPEEAAAYVAEPSMTLNLWSTIPGGIPTGMAKEKWTPGPEKMPIVRVSHVAIPTMALYKPEKPNGTCVVIFPGGGYNLLAYNMEGTEIAQWLNGLGITAIVVKYRIPRRAGLAKHEAALQDAQRAIRIARSNAEEWGFEPNKIGVLGFSAGGNLTVLAATCFNRPAYPEQDALDRISCRPDFMVPIYPAYLMDNEGEMKANVPLSNEIIVDKNTPPAFISVTDDDANRAAASARFYLQMKQNGVPCELHILVKGGHGYGLRSDKKPASDWNRPCEIWFKAMKLL